MFGYDVEYKSEKRIEELEKRNKKIDEQLKRTKRVLEDILQCHRINDRIGQRARQIVKEQTQ